MTQKLFPDFGSEGLREARLLNMAPEKGADRRGGEGMRENLEKLGPRYAEVIKQLHDAASFAGDASLQKMLEDPETQQMIASQVELPPGELTKKWLNEIAIVFLRKSHEAFKSEDAEVRGWKDKTTDQAKKCAEIFRATLTEIDAAKKLYGGELPGFSGNEGTKLLALLRRGAEQPKLKEKFDALIDLQKEILWANEDALKKTDSWKAKLKRVGLADASLTAIDTTVDPVARRRLLLKLVQDAAGVLTETDQNVVRGAIGKIDEALTKVDDERKAHLMSRFPERLKYLYRLGGSDMDAVVENAVARDGKFSFDVFETNLRALMGAKLDAGPRGELLRILGLANDKERKVVPPDALKKAAEYLRATLRLNNPTGISLSALALRARLPETMANELAESKLSIGLGTLIDVAGKLDTIAEGRISDPIEKYLESVLLDTKKIGPDDRKVLKDKDQFIEVVGFLLYGDGANPLERGTKAGQAAAKFWKDQIEDKGLVEKIDGTGVVKKGKEADLTAAIKTLSVTKQAADWHKAMRDGGVHECSWDKAVKQYASALGTTAAAAAPIWWDYIKSIPRNFWDGEGDPALLKILNRRKGLEQGKAALTSLLTTSNGAQELLKKSEVGLGHLKAAQEQAVNGDAVTSPRDNIEQARALLMANQYVIGQLNTLGWNLRSRRLRQLTLWTAMHKGTKKDPEAGLKEAMQLLQDSAAIVTPEEQDTFVDEQMAKMKPAERQAFLRTIDARAIVETQAGRDILSPYKQRGLHLNPRALDLLRQAKDPANPALNLAAGIGRWIMDPPEKVRASLEIALEDSPAKAAFLEAFVTGKEQAYEFQGRTEKVSVIDARLAVNAIQQRLLFEMRGSIKAKEQIEDEDEFTNPVDRWLRTGIESMKDLWNTDMIGKAEVIAIAFAAYWMIKEMWKNKKGKFVLLGLPILLGVNAIVKQRTGRDLLGENLRWKNKEERGSPLEAFRRRISAREKRYAVLMQPAGQAAIRVLMNEKNPVQIQQLLAWRNAVKAGDGKTYSIGAPSSLHVSDITDNLGATDSRERPYEVAYLAFEALCADVAHINGLAGGNTDTNAEQGADLIQRRYVANRSTSLKPATMFEVIMSECQMPTKEMLENRSYLEAAADMFGYTYDEAAALVKKYGVQAWVMMKQGVHKVPEIAGAVKEKVFSSAESVWDWMRVTGAKLGPEVKEDFVAAWDFVIKTGKDLGMKVVEVTPGVIGFVFDGTVNLTERTVGEIRKIHAYLLTMPELNAVKAFEESLARMFGIELLAELKEEEAKKQIDIEEKALVGLYAGDAYLMRDARLPVGVSISDMYESRLSEKLRFQKAGVALKREQVQEYLFKDDATSAANVITKGLYPGKTYKELLPAQKRRVHEVIQANLFQKISGRDDFQRAFAEYQRDLITASAETKRLKQEFDSKVKALHDFREHLHKIEPEYRLAWVLSETELNDRQTSNDQDIASKDALIKAKQIELNRLNSLDVSKFGRTELFIHEKRIQLLTKQITDTNTELGDLMKLKAKLPVYIELAKLGADRNPTQATAKVLRKMVGPQILIFTEAVKNYNEYQSTTTSVETAKAAELSIGEALKKSYEKERQIKNKGIATVHLDADALFKDWDATLLDQAVGVRETALLNPAYFEPYNILGLSVEVALGNAKDTAKKRVEVWKQYVLENDRSFQEAKAAGRDLDLIAAYERYLDHVGLNEEFLRILLTSPDGGEGEITNVMHLSLFEGRRLDRYLAERSRLVTFSRFKEAKK